MIHFSSLGNSKFLQTIGILGLFFTLISWALASPVGASPDEDHHLVSIWCAGSGVENMCTTTDDPGERLVSEILLATACFAQQPNVSAKCQVENHVFEASNLTETRRGNFSGNYPDGFYSTMSMFAGSDVQLSVITMRIFNASLFMLLWTVIWVSSTGKNKKAFYLTTVLTIVPLGLFLIPSINPSSWAIIGVITTFFSTVAALQSKNTRISIIMWAVAALGILLSGSARYDGLIYNLVGFVAAFIIAKQFVIPKRLFWFSLLGIGIIASAILAFGGSDLLVRLTGLAGTSGGGTDSSSVAVLVRNVLDFPIFIAGFSGAMGLGWLDTLLPTASWMITAGLLWAVLFTRLAEIYGHQLVVALGTGTLVAFVPLAVLQLNLAAVGENVQSRYIYPLFLVFVSTMLYRSKTKSLLFSKAQTVAIVLGLFISQFIALYVNMIRYIVGSGSPGFTANLNTAAMNGWWWPAAPPPMLILALGTIGFSTFLAMMFYIEKLSAKSPTHGLANA